MPLTDQAILDHIAAHPGAGREDIRRHVAPDVSAPTIWRALRRLVDEGKLEVAGKGRATGYSLAGAAVVRTHLQTPYNRRPPTIYNKAFLDRYIPNKSFYLGTADRERLHEAGQPEPRPLPAGTYARRILARISQTTSLHSSLKVVWGFAALGWAVDEHDRRLGRFFWSGDVPLLLTGRVREPLTPRRRLIGRARAPIRAARDGRRPWRS